MRNSPSVVPSLFILLAMTAALIYLPSEKGQPVKVAKGDAFDAAKALETTTTFVRACPGRVMGSDGSRKAADWIAQQFSALGIPTENQDFEVTIGGEQRKGRNVIGTVAGDGDEIIVLMAHYDSAATTIEGAMDDGSGIGILIELARENALKKPHHTFRFLASDGEEWGMLGARHFANSLADASRVKAVLSMDYVASGTLERISLGCVGQFGGYTPSWLRRVALAGVAAAGIPFGQPGVLIEHLERALLISSTDQGPLLNRGIAAVNFSSRSSSPNIEASSYHTAEDRADKLTVGAFESFGGAVRTTALTLDEMTSFPEESSSLFRLPGDRWVRPVWIQIAHWLWFFPLFIAAFGAWHSTRIRLASTSMPPERFALASCTLPWVAGYTLLFVLHRAGFMAQYELYPPPPGDPALGSPAWLPLLGALLVVILTMVVLRFIRAERGVLGSERLLATRTLGLVCLALLVVVALAYNTFWAMTFLVLPAWLWVLLPETLREEGRSAWVCIILASGAVFFTVVIYYGVALGITWQLPWFLILASITGMFNPFGVVLGILSLGLGWRLIRAYASPTLR